jgi:hypothetical protein
MAFTLVAAPFLLELEWAISIIQKRVVTCVVFVSRQMLGQTLGTATDPVAYCSILFSSYRPVTCDPKVRKSVFVLGLRRP